MYPMIIFELGGFLVGKTKVKIVFFFFLGRMFMEFLLVLVKRTRRNKKSQSIVSMPRK